MGVLGLGFLFFLVFIIKKCGQPAVNDVKTSSGPGRGRFPWLSSKERTAAYF